MTTTNDLVELFAAYFVDEDPLRLLIIRDAAEEAGRADVVDILDRWRVQHYGEKYETWSRKRRRSNRPLIKERSLWRLEKRDVIWSPYGDPWMMRRSNKYAAHHDLAIQLRFELPDDVLARNRDFARFVIPDDE